MPLSCVPWGWCPLGQLLQCATVTAWGWGAAWLCPPDHPAVSLRLILALVGFHHCSADFELLKAVFVHLSFDQEEEDDAGRQSNGPGGQPAVKEMERVGGEARALCHSGAPWTVPCSVLQPPQAPSSTPEPHRAAQPPSTDPLPPPEPLTRPPPPASSGSCPSCAWGCTPPPRGAPRCQAPDWPVVPLAGGSSARRAVCPVGPAAPRSWQDTLKGLLPPAVLRGERH